MRSDAAKAQVLPEMIRLLWAIRTGLQWLATRTHRLANWLAVKSVWFELTAENIAAKRGKFFVSQRIPPDRIDVMDLKYWVRK